MPRSVDVVNANTQALGFNMVTVAHDTQNPPSLAMGRHPCAVADAQTTALTNPNGVAGTPGGVLGTGMNTDRFTPGIEAV